MDSDNNPCSVSGVFFDFGGVIAEEGFRGGLKAIAEKHGKKPGDFFETAVKLIKETGYLTGETDETSFWRTLRFETGVQDTDRSMRGEILLRFIVRDWMIATVDALKMAGLATGILSDQTNWLDELDEKSGFMQHFDVVINSYHFGKSKYDGSIFDDASHAMGLSRPNVLFIDDTKQHVERADARGLKTIHFTYKGPDEFLSALKEFCPNLEVSK